MGSTVRLALFLVGVLLGACLALLLLAEPAARIPQPAPVVHIVVTPSAPSQRV